MNCKNIVKKYLEYLSDKFTVVEIPGGCKITTPFSNFSGKSTQFYVEKTGKNFYLSDFGETLGNLKSFNIEFSGDTLDYFNTIKKIYGIFEKDEELFINTNEKELTHSLHSFINALQAISDLEFRKRQAYAERFDVKIRSYLSMRKVPYTPNQSIEIGQFEFAFDLISMNQLILVQTIGTVRERDSQIFSMTETKMFPFLVIKYRKIQKRTVSILDEKTEWSGRTLRIIRECSSEILNWGEEEDKESLVTLLEKNVPL